MALTVALVWTVAAAEEEVVRAVAVIHPTQGNEARGYVEFVKVEGRVRVRAEMEGLEPNQAHGFHVHEWGDCSDRRAERAGGHFDPEDAPHGGPREEERHVGDLGNIQADENGVGRYDRVDAHLSFTGEDSIIGRSVVVHEEKDDLETQPTGDAGARIGCGVIGIAEPRD